MDQFQQDISVLTHTTVAHAIDTIKNNDTATYFIGRSTCPYCRKFATKLAKVVKDNHATVYFINSEDGNELNNLADFRGKYAIKTVPGFVHVKQGHVSVRCDSSMTEAAIKEFMEA